jgi:hypothetical protein
MKEEEKNWGKNISILYLEIWASKDNFLLTYLWSWVLLEDPLIGQPLKNFLKPCADLHISLTGRHCGALEFSPMHNFRGKTESQCPRTSELRLYMITVVSPFKNEFITNVLHFITQNFTDNLVVILTSFSFVSLSSQLPYLFRIRFLCQVGHVEWNRFYFSTSKMTGVTS